MEDTQRSDYVKRINYIEGHLKGVRKMIEEDKYCVDVLRQTLAIRKAIQKLEALMLEGHLRECVPAGLREGRQEQVIGELIDLYHLAEN